MKLVSWRHLGFVNVEQLCSDQFANNTFKIRPLGASHADDITRNNCVPHSSQNLSPYLFPTEAEQLWDIVILPVEPFSYTSCRCTYNPQLVGFPKHDTLHLCTSIKDRAATHLISLIKNRKISSLPIRAQSAHLLSYDKSRT